MVCREFGCTAVWYALFLSFWGHDEDSCWRNRILLALAQIVAICKCDDMSQLIVTPKVRHLYLLFCRNTLWHWQSWNRSILFIRNIQPVWNEHHCSNTSYRYVILWWGSHIALTYSTFGCTRVCCAFSLSSCRLTQILVEEIQEFVGLSRYWGIKWRSRQDQDKSQGMALIYLVLQECSVVLTILRWRDLVHQKQPKSLKWTSVFQHLQVCNSMMGDTLVGCTSAHSPSA